MHHLSSELAAIVERFGSPRIVVLGDLMLDEYIYGDAERLSPEAPVPVVQERHRQHRCGGAGNVAVFLTALGAKVDLIGVCGDDNQGHLLRADLRDAGVNVACMLVITGRPTCTKTRLVGLAQHRHPQQMLRLDREDVSWIGPEHENTLRENLRQGLAGAAALCIEDYNKGLLSQSLCPAAIDMARELGVPVLVDPAAVADYSRYRRASVITPNRTEAELATGRRMEAVPLGAAELARDLYVRLGLDACVITLDKHGMYLLDGPEGGTLHPTKPRTVYDVTGAGDMVLAMLAMAISAGATWSQAVDLGNVAGGLEVERFGCVPLGRREVVSALLPGEAAAEKVRGLATLNVALASRRAAGKRIVFTNGVFDILHAGHVRYLQFARSHGDVLVVGVNSDASVRRLKGSGRPVNSLADRMAVLAALACVDFVVDFTGDTPLELVRAVAPDVLVKGEDYAGKEVVGREVVEARGGSVVLAPFLAGHSTTSTLEKLA
ncbi:MAG: D-glycero-beta-D-manno-heptose 1-phosphate adenylyltransferase [Phycisphaerae bacterium]|nr:D-glycero-beta-D-manno-heptose 1-phosphate adenylyltransferase [Phycisphaerae bacterium]